MTEREITVSMLVPESWDEVRAVLACRLDGVSELTAHIAMNDQATTETRNVLAAAGVDLRNPTVARAFLCGAVSIMESILEPEHPEEGVSIRPMYKAVALLCAAAWSDQ